MASPGVAVRRASRLTRLPREIWLNWLGRARPGTSEGPLRVGGIQSLGGPLPAGLASLIRPTTTGPDGRFRLTGPGRERLVSLLIQGPRTATQALSVMTRADPPHRSGRATRSEEAGTPDLRACDPRGGLHLRDGPDVAGRGDRPRSRHGAPAPRGGRPRRASYRTTFFPTAHPWIDWPGMMIRHDR